MLGKGLATKAKGSPEKADMADGLGPSRAGSRGSSLWRAWLASGVRPPLLNLLIPFGEISAIFVAAEQATVFYYRGVNSPEPE